MKVAEFAEATTVRDAGTGSAALFDASATTAPPAGAVWFSVTVHVVPPPDVMLAGLQPRESTLRTGVTVTVAVALPPSVAVTVAVCAATEAAVAVNATTDDPAGTVTDPGTCRAALLEASVTSPPPAGAI